MRSVPGGKVAVFCCCIASDGWLLPRRSERLQLMTNDSSSPRGDGDPRGNRKSRGKHKLTIDQGVATVVAACILAAGGIIGIFVGRASVSNTKHTVTAGPTVFITVTASAPSTPSKTSASTPVWTSAYPMLIGHEGIDFDSIPPVTNSGTDTLFLYLGSYLYASGSTRIAKWINNVQPTRNQCNVSAQTQGDYQQPAEVGQRYCFLTGHGHTVYLKITSIDNSNSADVKAYADVIVWNTAG
jgi:hypothetical protein